MQGTMPLRSMRYNVLSGTPAHRAAIRTLQVFLSEVDIRDPVCDPVGRLRLPGDHFLGWDRVGGGIPAGLPNSARFLRWGHGHFSTVAHRKHADQSQQVFATRLGMSISSLQNYEQNRTPEPRQLVAFQREAEAAGQKDLAKVFRDELMKSLALSMDEGIFTTADQFETLAVTTLLFWIRDRNPAARAVIKQIATELGDEEDQEFLAEAFRRGFINTPPRRDKK